MKTQGWILLMSLGVALGSGCTQNVNTVERADSQATPQVVKDKRVEASSGVAAKARVVKVIETGVSGDLAKVQVELYNSTTLTQQIHYRFEWYDNAGMFIDSPMSIWKPLTLRAKEIVPLTSVSPTPNARDFRLKLQESN